VTGKEAGSEQRWENLMGVHLPKNRLTNFKVPSPEINFGQVYSC
jgi:hypothetical protein